MDYRLPADVVALAEEAREVGLKAVVTRPYKEDAWITGFDREFSLELGRRGWLGMTWPTELGGGGRSALERFVVTEALIATGAPLAATWMGDRQIGPTIVKYGTPEQQAKYLPPLIEGSVTWAIGLSEPDAGSDVANIRTRAELDGDQYVINGQKIWTSSAAVADHVYLIARTGEGGRGHAGMSEFIVDMNTPGVTTQPITDPTREDHFYEVYFDNVHVPKENLVGTLGESFKQVMGQLEHERAGIDRLVSNHALFLDAREAADTSDRRTRDEIARLETDYIIGRFLVLKGVLGQAPAGFSAVTKTFCTEHEQRVANFAARVFGAQTMLEGRLSRAVLYAPAYTIQGGTTNVLRNIVAERLLGLPKG